MVMEAASLLWAAADEAMMAVVAGRLYRTAAAAAAAVEPHEAQSLPHHYHQQRCCSFPNPVLHPLAEPHWSHQSTSDEPYSRLSRWASLQWSSKYFIKYFPISYVLKALRVKSDKVVTHSLKHPRTVFINRSKYAQLNKVIYHTGINEW